MAGSKGFKNMGKKKKKVKQADIDYYGTNQPLETRFGNSQRQSVSKPKRKASVKAKKNAKVSAAETEKMKAMYSQL